MSKVATDTLEKVSTEFEGEVLTDLDEAKKLGLSTLSSAKKDAADVVTKILETSVKQAESIKRQIIGAAELEVRNGQLRSLERAVNEVFDGAIKEVGGVSGARYEKSLTDLVKEGVDIIGLKAKVQTNQRDKKSVSAVLRKLNGGNVKLTLEERPAQTIGGVILTTTEGSVKFDNTFEARLERMRPALRKEVAAILTGE